MSIFDELGTASTAGREECQNELMWASEIAGYLHTDFATYLGCSPEKLVPVRFDNREEREAFKSFIFPRVGSLHFWTDGFWRTNIYLKLPQQKIDFAFKFRQVDGYLRIAEDFFGVDVYKDPRNNYPTDPDILFIKEVFFPALSERMLEKLKSPMNSAYSGDFSILQMF